MEPDANMPLLLFLARAFIQTFGITQPSPSQERRAAWFIGAAMLLIVLGVLACIALFVLPRRA